MKKEVLGITGLAGAGKDTAAEYLRENYGFKWLNFSDILVEEAKKRGLKTNKINLSKLGNEYREEYGKAGLAVKIMEEIKSSGNSKFVVTGFRSPEEVEYIKNRVNSFMLIEMRTKKELRWRRRKESDPQTKKEFFKRDKEDIKKKGLGKVLKMSDQVIKNNSTRESLYKILEELLRDFRNQ